MKKMKITMYLLAVMMALDAAILIANHEWLALLWEAGFILMAILFERDARHRDMIIRQRDVLIDELMDDYTYKKFIIAERRAACSESNARRYLLENQKLKAENERLKVLNKNLIENKNTGVKNYATKTTKPRKS